MPVLSLAKRSTDDAIHPTNEVLEMLIDCETCAMRDIACSDCVITMLFHGPAPTELDDDEFRAVGALADAGLIAPLRLVPLLAVPSTPVRPRPARRSIA